jgi:endonuclease/exonuclease/phosphatase family metal-dependent hydrolase
MTRLAWPVLVLLGVGVVGVGPGAGPAAAQPPPALRVLSYNILHGGVLSGLTGNDDDLDARLRIAVEAVRRLDPDVVGVQEASWGRGRGNVAERLARALGLHYVFGPALFRIFPAEFINHQIASLMNFSEGPAILSRFPIVASRVYDLPRCAGLFDPRVLVHATLRTPWGDLDVASAHTSRGFCEADRVVELMTAGRGPLPSVLMGDFNSREESPGIRRVLKAGFVDAFRAANPAASGPTTYQRVHEPAPTAVARVDYVFLVPGRAMAGRVRQSRVVLDTPRRTEDGAVLWPSDHYGVLAELEVFPAGPASATAAAGTPGGSPP